MPDTSIRLDDAITYFLGEWPAEGPSPDTIRGYTASLKWLVGFAHKRGKTELADLTPQLVRAALIQKQDAHNQSVRFKGGEHSAKALLSAARCLVRWLRSQGLPAADLMVVKAPKAPERIQPRLKEDEFQALEQAILQRLIEPDRRVPRVAIARDLALIYLLADTGLRASEVCAMDIRSVDFAQGAVLVIRGKGKKERALSLIDSDATAGSVTLKLLSDWIETRPEVHGAARNTKLWVSMKGNPFTRESLRRVLLNLCLRAGIDGNRPPHAFRRASFTERYLASPSSIRVLASRMGWSDKSHHMIDVYTRGANVELSRTTPVASLSARWHAGASRPAPRRPAPRPAPTKRSPDVQALLAAVKADPEVRRALLRALQEGAV